MELDATPPEPTSLARVARVSTGGLLVVAGLAMLVLPGPGVVTVVAGLAVLERDLPVARRTLGYARRGWSASVSRWARWFGPRETTGA